MSTREMKKQPMSVDDLLSAIFSRGQVNRVIVEATKKKKDVIVLSLGSSPFALDTKNGEYVLPDGMKVEMIWLGHIWMMEIRVMNGQAYYQFSCKDIYGDRDTNPSGALGSAYHKVTGRCMKPATSGRLIAGVFAAPLQAIICKYHHSALLELGGRFSEVAQNAITNCTEIQVRQFNARTWVPKMPRIRKETNITSSPQVYSGNNVGNGNKPHAMKRPCQRQDSKNNSFPTSMQEESPAKRQRSLFVEDNCDKDILEDLNYVEKREQDGHAFLKLNENDLDELLIYLAIEESRISSFDKRPLVDNKGVLEYSAPFLEPAEELMFDDPIDDNDLVADLFQDCY